MKESGHLLGEHYKDLYADYYRHNVVAKREMSAAQTVKYMRRALGELTVDRVIDVGAGEGSVLSEMSRCAIAREMHAVEISESGVEAIRSRRIPGLVQVELFDGYRLPYPDKYFDLATAVHVLEHVEHERIFLREIGRVARRLYVEVPLEHGIRIQRSIITGGKYGHINFYMKHTLRSLLESVGLTVVRCEAFAPSLEYEQHVGGRVKGRLKSAIRNIALALSPEIAPWLMVFNCYALCECD